MSVECRKVEQGPQLFGRVPVALTRSLDWRKLCDNKLHSLEGENAQEKFRSLTSTTHECGSGAGIEGIRREGGITQPGKDIYIDLLNNM